MIKEKIAIVLVGGEKRKIIKEATKKIGWVELRVDKFLKNFSESHLLEWIKEIKKLTNKKIIGTIRWYKEQANPKFYISEEKRITIYKKIIPFVDYIDVEVKSKIAPSIINYARIKNKKIILSYHNFITTPNPNELEKLYLKSKKLNCDIFKIATKVNDFNDILTLLNFIHKKKNKVIAIPMGVSIFERLVFVFWGSFLTYVSIKEKTAPGQPSYQQIIKLLNTKI